MRDVPYGKLAAAMLVLTVVVSVIMLIPDWNGEQGSTAADDIDRLFEISIVFSSFVFSVVMVLLGYSIWKWRALPGDESDGEPIHGNTRLEIAWTAIPTVIVIFLAALSWIVLDDIEAKENGGDPITIEVTGQQFTWSFVYPDEGIVSKELHVPVDQQIDVQLADLVYQALEHVEVVVAGDPAAGGHQHPAAVVAPVHPRFDPALVAHRDVAHRLPGDGVGRL